MAKNQRQPPNIMSPQNQRRSYNFDLNEMIDRTMSPDIRISSNKISAEKAAKRSIVVSKLAKHN